ncbi:DUF2812 domain-containing protein [Terribacillus sp. DMT04]|uniref:DUF2812 domain-containing protein n=1 Tax=Terribacillus sp. DMT04 TaxID=2850441 RepID=UPI001C2C5BCC|nr:DUF2812 domain-containing protein [Terribacillus sp. DMT04]QXE03285.1 DUF2812 domain-containing protein [Terribacillus sp. DMT04]
MAEIKKVRKWFWAWSDQREEVWLQKMAQEGWQLERYSWFTYYFKATSPTKLVYRLDYQIGLQNQEYFQLFEDDGWEYVTGFGGWLYFCKESDGSDKLEIYSDSVSRAYKYVKVANFVLFILLMQLFAWLPLSAAMPESLWVVALFSPIYIVGIIGIYLLRNKAKKLKEYQI